MKLDKESTQPLYIQLMIELKTMLNSGEYKAGDKIPTEPELARIYGISRITVRKTIEELCNEGYLIKKQGKGTFVQSPIIHRRIEMNKSMSFTEACINSGTTATGHILSHEIIKPKKWHRSFLKLEEEEGLLYIRRLRCADDIPVFLEELYFPQERFGTLKIDELENGSLFKILSRDHDMPETPDGHSTIEAVTADKNEAAILNIQQGEAVLLMSNYWLDSNQHPAYISVEHIVGSRYRITI